MHKFGAEGGGKGGRGAQGRNALPKVAGACFGCSSGRGYGSRGGQGGTGEGPSHIPCPVQLLSIQGQTLTRN